MGGANPTHRQMIDNWRYDLTAATWTRISDQPFPGESWSALVMEDRYILMFDGFLGREVIDPSGVVIQERNPDMGFTDRVLAYDTLLDKYFDATSMPRELADTRVVWLQDGETIYSLTAEIDGSQHISPATIRVNVEGDPREVLVSEGYLQIDDLKPGAHGQVTFDVPVRVEKERVDGTDYTTTWLGSQIAEIVSRGEVCPLPF